ncbi:hypothetical protein DENSPDRAFT_354869 [Dentipellis sp. KUC8613]|nr:hypothetical protein DENSPDRAFT_354869 [Dentipellis sp. KUC8613]
MWHNAPSATCCTGYPPFLVAPYAVCKTFFEPVCAVRTVVFCYFEKASGVTETVVRVDDGEQVHGARRQSQGGMRSGRRTRWSRARDSPSAMCAAVALVLDSWFSVPGPDSSGRTGAMVIRATQLRASQAQWSEPVHAQSIHRVLRTMIMARPTVNEWATARLDGYGNSVATRLWTGSIDLELGRLAAAKY